MPRQIPPDMPPSSSGLVLLTFGAAQLVEVVFLQACTSGITCMLNQRAARTCQLLFGLWLAFFAGEPGAGFWPPSGSG